MGDRDLFGWARILEELKPRRIEMPIETTNTKTSIDNPLQAAGTDRDAHHEDLHWPPAKGDKWAVSQRHNPTRSRISGYRF